MCMTYMLIGVNLMQCAHIWNYVIYSPIVFRGFIHEVVRRLTARSHQVSKSRDLGSEFSNRSEIWQALRQRRCRDACQIAERYDHYNIHFASWVETLDYFTCTVKIIQLPQYQWSDTEEDNGKIRNPWWHHDTGNASALLAPFQEIPLKMHVMRSFNCLLAYWIKSRCWVAGNLTSM